MSKGMRGLLHFLFLFIIFTGFTALKADSEGTPMAMVTVSEEGTAYFKMAPWDLTKSPFPSESNQGSGTAYLVLPDGRVEEKWSVQGWYAWQVFISDDAHYLVRMGPWSEGDTPSKSDLALAFYADGKLLKEYSTIELLKDPSKVIRSASHYQWLPLFLDSRATKPSLEGYDGSFRLVTCDGWLYRFSLKSGEILETRRSEPVVADWATGEQIDRLAIALLVAKYPTEYQDYFKAIGLGYYQMTNGSTSGNRWEQTLAITDPMAPGGYEAVEVQIENYNYKGGKDGAGSGSVIGASLVHISAKGLHFEWTKSGQLKRFCESLQKQLGEKKLSPAEFAEHAIKQMNGRFLLTQ